MSNLNPPIKVQRHGFKFEIQNDHRRWWVYRYIDKGRDWYSHGYYDSELEAREQIKSIVGKDYAPVKIKDKR